MKRLILACMLTLVLAACGLTSPSSVPIAIASDNPPAVAQPLVTTEPAALEGCVTNPTTLIRKSPDADAEAVTGIVAGTCIAILERNADSTWLHVRIKDNLTGWVNVRYVKIKPPPIPVTVVNTSPAPTDTPSVENIPPCSQFANQINSNVTCKLEQASCQYRSDIGGNPSFCSDRPAPDYIFELTVQGQDWSDFDGHCLIVSGFLEAKFDGQKAWLQMLENSRSQVSDC